VFQHAFFSNYLHIKLYLLLNEMSFTDDLLLVKGSGVIQVKLWFQHFSQVCVLTIVKSIAIKLSIRFVTSK